MFELRTFPGVGHLVTSSETQSCREWKISRTSAMNTQTQRNTKCKRHKHVHTNKNIQALVKLHFALVTFLLIFSEGQISIRNPMLL